MIYCRRESLTGQLRNPDIFVTSANMAFTCLCANENHCLVHISVDAHYNTVKTAMEPHPIGRKKLSLKYN